MEQLAPGPRELPQLLLTIVNALSPEMLGVVNCAALFPLFATATCLTDEVPCCCEPKSSGLGESVTIGGGKPVPLRVAVT